MVYASSGSKGEGDRPIWTVAIVIAALMAFSLIGSVIDVNDRVDGQGADNITELSDTLSNLAFVIENPPTSLEAVEGNGQVSLSWTAPVDADSDTTYNVYVNDEFNQNVGTVSAVVTGLENGQTYRFSVTALDSDGEGPRSSVVTARPSAPISVPGAPTSLRAQPGNNQVSLSWSAPASNGGADIDYYIVYRNNAEAARPSGTSWIDTAAFNGVTYEYSVSAHNSAGLGPSSSTVQATPVQTITLPGSPTGLTATPGFGQVSLYWTPPADNGGGPIDYYMIYQDGAVVSQATLTYATIGGLNIGQPYSFAVAAHNSAGLGPVSSAVSSTPVQFVTVPGVPTALNATPGDGQITLAWSAPTDDGGTPIDYYVVYKNGEDVVHSTTTTIVVTGLANGLSYSFTVAAHNLVGMGEQSVSLLASPVAGVTVPGVPTDVSLNAGDGQVTISWSPPADDGGSPIDYYIVYKDGENVALTTDTTITITGLTNGQTYLFTIGAHNSGGLGTMSAAMEALPKKASGGDNGNWMNMAIIGGIVLVAGMGVSLYLFRNRD